MTRFVAFGEIMARFAPPGLLRLRQTLPGSLEVTFAGAEANTAGSLALLAADVAFVTALPADNPLADACLASLRALGIDLRHVLLRDIGRLGLYFLETGANQRPGRVFYDRDNSAISLTPADAYDWNAILAAADWLHVTGITPALSRLAADATLVAVTSARRRGVAVSCDLNYRAKLWRWDPNTPPRDLAARTLHSVLENVDLLFASPADADLLGLGPPPADDERLDPADCAAFARAAAARFPNLRRVATTLRTSHSASHNDWGAALYDVRSARLDVSPRHDDGHRPYEIRSIVDRVGAGDAFAAGLLFALAHDDYPTDRHALDFATAAACLAHSIPGDLNVSARSEIDALAAGSASGRVVR